MVGHTHEDIDQFFSKFSQYLRHNAAHILPGNKVILPHQPLIIFILSRFFVSNHSLLRRRVQCHFTGENAQY